MPRVSVIIPTYNAEKHLPRALESVLAQTYRDFEIVVVNDGSTDGTEAAIAPYRDRIIYVRQENRGTPAARNRAIAAAGGELLALLDDDDEWLPQKLEAQVAAFSDPAVGLAYGDVRTVYDDGTVLPAFLPTRPQACEGDIFEALLAKPFIVPSTVVLRRQAVEQAGGFDEALRHTDDLDLWLRICQKWHAALIRSVMAVRHERMGNMTSDWNGMTAGEVKLWEKVVRMQLSPHQARLARSRLAHFRNCRAFALSGHGRRREARHAFIRCALRQPNHVAWIGLAATIVPAEIWNWLPRFRHLRQAIR